MSSGSVADVRRAKRILTYGVTGSGKSTLAQALASARALPYISIDDVCWDPEWSQPESEEIDRRVLPLLDQDSYVIDSVYGRHNQVALDRVDVVVALDYPRLTSLRRLVRRTWRRATTGETCCNGNTETWRRALGRDSIIRWHFQSFASKRERLRQWHADPEAPPVVVLRRPREAEDLLASL